MRRLWFILLTIALQGSAAWPIFARTPTNTPPVLAYTLSIDTTDLTGYNITIHVYHAPSRFHLAMAAHHEYCAPSFFPATLSNPIRWSRGRSAFVYVSRGGPACPLSPYPSTSGRLAGGNGARSGACSRPTPTPGIRRRHSPSITGCPHPRRAAAPMDLHRR